MRRKVQDSIIILGCNNILKEPFSLIRQQNLVRILEGLNDWAGLAPQLLGGLEPESLQEFTPMAMTAVEAKKWCGIQGVGY